MMIEEFAIIAAFAIFGGIIGIIIYFAFALPIIVPAGIHFIHFIHLGFAKQSHCGKLGVHYTVPCLEHDVYFSIIGVERHSGVIAPRTTVTIGCCRNRHIIRQIIGQAVITLRSCIHIEFEYLTVSHQHKIEQYIALLVVVPIVVVVYFAP